MSTSTSSFPTEDEATAVCPSCEQAIPLDRIAVHLAGLDGARPECPRQDLIVIAQREREQGDAAWATPWWCRR